MVEWTGLDGPKVDKTAVPLQCMSLKRLQLQVDITGVVVLIDKNMEYVITDESDDSDVDTSLQYSVKWHLTAQ